jgi:hypothetical protein
MRTAVISMIMPSWTSIVQQVTEMKVVPWANEKMPHLEISYTVEPGANYNRIVPLDRWAEVAGRHSTQLPHALTSFGSMEEGSMEEGLLAIGTEDSAEFILEERFDPAWFIAREYPWTAELIDPIQKVERLRLKKRTFVFDPSTDMVQPQRLFVAGPEELLKLRRVRQFVWVSRAVQKKVEEEERYGSH